MIMKRIFYFFISAIAIASIIGCRKQDDPKIIPDVTGVWETDANTIPGWIVGFRPNGEFCELEKTVTAFPDCGFTWYQSADSVFIIGEQSRLWIVESDSDTSFIATVVDQCGKPVDKMRFK